MKDIRETKAVKEALALADLVMASDNAIGEITGPAGTGKTMAGRAVAAKLGAIRIAAWDGMTRHQLLATVAAAIGMEGPGSADRVLRRGAEAERVMLVVDEANKLSWRVLETIRYLADECGFAVLLIGTELYTRKFADARTRPLLVQLGSRIGAITDKELVTAFWQACRKGNYREAVELAEECRRIMVQNGLQALTPSVLELAAKWMANRHAAEAA